MNAWRGTNSAHALATFAHLGQTDKAGVVYIAHPVGVSGLFRVFYEDMYATDREMADHGEQACLLHDLFEDTFVTREMLEHFGCPSRVVETVHLLTRHKDVSRQEYYAAIKEHPLALAVKDCDIAHNTHPQRMRGLRYSVRLRLTEKYAEALEALGLTSRWENS